MAKPIFVIRLDKNTSMEERHAIFHNMKKEMADLFEEYHVIFASGENKHIEFECYNPDDIPEEIRKRTSGLILDIISKQQF